MTAEGETAPIDVPIHSQLSALLFCEFNFYTACVEVLTSVQVGQKLSFGLPTNLVGSLFFYSRQLVGKLILEILSNLGRIIFLKIFRKTLLKMPFSSATTGRDLFCRHSPKRQSHRLPLEETF